MQARDECEPTTMHTVSLLTPLVPGGFSLCVICPCWEVFATP